MPLDMGGGAGGAQMLQEVLARKLQEQQMLAQQRNMREQRALQQRGQDVQIAGQDAAQHRFDVQRQDALTAAAAEAEAAKQAAAGQETFEQTLPEYARAAFHASGHKHNFSPAELAEAPETRAQTDDRAFGKFTRENDARVAGQLKVLGAKEASAKRLASIKGVPVAGAKAAQAAAQEQQQANEVADTLTLIDRIKGDKSLNNAVGPMDQYAGGIINVDPAGVNRFKSLHNELVGKLSLAQAGKLKGQGQISDKERAMLASAATALNRGLSEKDYLTELQNVRGQFERMQGGGGGGPMVQNNGEPQPGATKRFPNGKTGVWDGHGWVAQ